jgi:exosortase
MGTECARARHRGPGRKGEAVATLRDTTSDSAAPWTPTVSDVIAIVAVLAAVGVAYASSIGSLIDQWKADPNYSYGFFVAPIAALIFWSRRGMLDRSRMRPRWWGFLPLVAVVALRFPMFEWNQKYAETATIPLVLAGLALALGGWHLLRVAWPAILFLVFMLPLPPSVNAYLARPLQNVATLGSVALLQLFGLPVLSEGNVIYVGASRLEVARACNGLSMLLSFVTLVTATVILVRRPVYERVVLLLSAIPIALVSNILRITVTAMCYHWLGEETGERFAHDPAGWAMMFVALGLVWLELRALSWLFVEVEEIDAKTMLRKRRAGMSP